MLRFFVEAYLRKHCHILHQRIRLRRIRLGRSNRRPSSTTLLRRRSVDFLPSLRCCILFPRLLLGGRFGREASKTVRPNMIFWEFTLESIATIIKSLLAPVTLRHPSGGVLEGADA